MANLSQDELSASRQDDRIHFLYDFRMNVSLEEYTPVGAQINQEEEEIKSQPRIIDSIKVEEDDADDTTAMFQKKKQVKQENEENVIIINCGLRLFSRTEQDQEQEEQQPDKLDEVHEDLERSKNMETNQNEDSSGVDMNQTNKDNLTCYICKQRFQSAYACGFHVRGHFQSYNGELCPYCGYAYTSETDKQDHDASHELRNDQQTQIMSKCHVCDASFGENEDLRRHLEDLHAYIPCHYCRKMLKSRKRLAPLPAQKRRLEDREKIRKVAEEDDMRQ